MRVISKDSVLQVLDIELVNKDFHVMKTTVKGVVAARLTLKSVTPDTYKLFKLEIEGKEDKNNMDGARMYSISKRRCLTN